MYFTVGLHFESVFDSHLIPKHILGWARMDEMPSNALDQFIEERVELVIEELKRQLNGIKIEVIDTIEKKNY